MSEEVPKKRPKRDDDYKDLKAYSANLEVYLYRLEFTYLENLRKIKNLKKLFGNKVVKFSEDLVKCGFCLPEPPKSLLKDKKFPSLEELKLEASKDIHKWVIIQL